MHVYVKRYLIFLAVGVVVQVCALALSLYEQNGQLQMPLLERAIFDEHGATLGTTKSCTNSSDCPANSACKQQGPIDWECVCNDGWIDRNDVMCSYQQKPQLDSFLISVFVGIFGADWFYLSRGNGWYIFAGIVKLLSLGCVEIWAIVDWIRILCRAFPDGNNVELKPW
jgi:hypothetical protein